MARKKITAPQPDESATQTSVMQFLDNALPDDAFAFHVPNGGKRNVIEGAKLKRMGVKAGVPDICIIYRGWAYGIEMKSGKGKLSMPQIVTHSHLARAGLHVQTCRTALEVESALKGWEIPLRARVSA